MNHPISEATDQAKLLIVDDEPNNLYAMKRIVGSKDIEIIEASSGEQALREAIRHEFFLILMDVQMPVMNGFEAASLLLSNQKTANTPIIFVTAISKSERFVHQGYTSGAVDYIYKPIDPEIINGKVNVFRQLWLQRKALQQSNETLAETNQKYLEEIHQHQETELALSESRNAANAANRAKSVLLANMSHELRTPLNAILGFVQILQIKENIPEDSKTKLQSIFESSKHLLKILNNLLNAAKIDSGQMVLTAVPFNLTMLLRELEIRYRPYTITRGISLLFEADNDLPQYLESDEGKIRQVLSNLVDNAAKATDQGHVKVTTRSETLADGKINLTFTVEDTGSGIARPHLETIFGAFDQPGQSEGLSDGAGLGLAMSRGLARMLGGDISVRSELGQGSCFEFNMTAKACDETVAIESGHLQHPLGLAKDQPDCTILMVDDGDVNFPVSSERLQGVGFNTFEVTSAQANTELFQEIDPQVVLVSIADSDFSNEAFIRAVRELPGGDKVAMIVIVADPQEPKIQALLEQNIANAALYIPFNEGNLFTVIAENAGVSYRYEDD